MKIIRDINELKPGDKIISIDYNYVETREFLCIHPHNEDYSLFLDFNLDGMKKFWNQRLEEEEWYLYSDDEWDEICKIQIKELQAKIAYCKSLLKS